MHGICESFSTQYDGCDPLNLEFIRINQGRRPEPPRKQEGYGSKSLHDENQAASQEQEPQRFGREHDGQAARTCGGRCEKVSEVILARCAHTRCVPVGRLRSVTMESALIDDRRTYD